MLIYIKVVQNIKGLVIELSSLSLPIDLDYLVIETDGSKIGWGGTLLRNQINILQNLKKNYVDMP